jgi:hypothetical protein
MVYLVPVLALIALMAWALASPIGSSPDDDFHLASVWCANPANTSACLPGPTADSRVVPKAVNDAATCYFGQPSQSAKCQAEVIATGSAPSVTTNRGNFVGAYPPLYYAAMSVFVGSDVVASIVVMRVVNIALFVGLTSVLFLLLPRPRRVALVAGWVVSTVPLGMFLIASNNPSSWSIIGIGTAWLALVGYFESTGAKKVGLGVIFAVSAIMAAGSRADGAAYVGVAIAVAIVLTFRARVKYLVDALLPFALAVVAVFFFLASKQSNSGLEGFGGEGSTGGNVIATPDGAGMVGQTLANIINLPWLWAGVFGYTPLGWFDTVMPTIVVFGAVSCFVVIVFAGLTSLSRRKGFALLGVALVLAVLPIYVLGKGGDVMGQAVQPRYILPLVIVFAGLAVLSVGTQGMRFTRPQLVVLVATLSIAQFLALYTTMRRYIQGVGGSGWNLDRGIEWWWDIPFSPMFVLIIGSAAYTGLLVLVARELAPAARRSVELVAGAK